MFSIHKVIVKRDSICLADDCTAPNTCEFTFSSDERIKDLIIKIARYVPEMSDVVWSINSSGKPIGYVSFCSDSKKYDLVIDNIRIAELSEKNIYCKFYNKNKLLDFSITPPELLYPECATFLEKVKMHEVRGKDYF